MPTCSFPTRKGGVVFNTASRAKCRPSATVPLQANTNCLKIIVRKPLLLLLVPLNVLHLVLLLLQPLALTQEHEEPLLDTDRRFVC